MRCLLLISWTCLLTGCAGVYKNLQPATGDADALSKFKPAFKVALYKASVDVQGYQLSGLLIIKRMPDSTLRLVFSNEVGFTFFDFEFSSGGGFKVISIINKIDKKAVIRTLRKDFELVLMEGIEQQKGVIRKTNGELYYSYPRSKGYHHYITSFSGDELIRLERSSGRKRVIQAVMKNYRDGIPDTIGITHYNFNFKIGLKRIDR